METTSPADPAEVTRRIGGLFETYQRRLTLEVIEPILADLDKLGREMREEFAASLESDSSPESIEWFARNARKLAEVQTFLEKHRR